jgi:hypothetical protein
MIIIKVSFNLKKMKYFIMIKYYLLLKKGLYLCNNIIKIKNKNKIFFNQN